MISMLRVWRDLCTFRRRRLPMKIRRAETAAQTRYAPRMPPISYGSFDLSLSACADRGGPWSGGGAGLSQTLMCQMLTGAACTKLRSRPRASAGGKMVMAEQFPPVSAGELEIFVAETGLPLAQGRFATACALHQRGR